MAHKGQGTTATDTGGTEKLARSHQIKTSLKDNLGKLEGTVRSCQVRVVFKREIENIQNEDNRQLPRGSYTQIMVNPTQLSDREFAAWMERLVEARRNRQENKPRPYRQFRKPFLRGRGQGEETQCQQELKQKLIPAEELNTEELTTVMRCEYADIEEAMEMYNLDVEECRSA